MPSCSTHSPPTAARNYVEAVRDRLPQVKRVVVEHGGGPHPLADRTVESFRPDQLLETVRTLFPQQSAELERKEASLEQTAAAAQSEAKVIDAATIGDAVTWLTPRETMVVLNDRALLSLVMRLNA